MRVWSKKVLDSRFPILVTRCEKRSKTFFDFAVFGMQVASLLIDFLIADYADYAGKFGVVNERSLGRIVKQAKRGIMAR
jgi:hypothetical protein